MGDGNEAMCNMEVTAGGNEASRHRFEERAFQNEDVAGCAVVFAATNDADANLRVLEACRHQGFITRGRKSRTSARRVTATGG